MEGEEKAPQPEAAPRGERARPRDDRPRDDRPRDDRPRDDREATHPDSVQLFVNVGKREGLTPGDLQRLLADKGLSEEDAGRVRVRDRMSFITVKKGAFDRALAALNGHVIGGRTVVAELARGRG